jgi:hypothetical protein
VSRRLLSIVLLTIAVTAALGVYAVAVPQFGELQAKVLGTSASVSGACILTLACLPGWERNRLRPLSQFGTAAAVLGFALLIAGIWSEPSADYWKAAVTVLLLALWAGIASLLALARLVSRYRWVFWTAIALVFCFAAIGMGGMWSEPSAGAYARVAGAVGVLTAAFVLAVPVLHRANRGQRSGGPTGPSLVGFCPSCGSAVRAEPDRTMSCPQCRSRFRVSFE